MFLNGLRSVRVLGSGVLLNMLTNLAKAQLYRASQVNRARVRPTAIMLTKLTGLEVTYAHSMPRMSLSGPAKA